MSLSFSSSVEGRRAKICYGQRSIEHERKIRHGYNWRQPRLTTAKRQKNVRIHKEVAGGLLKLYRSSATRGNTSRIRHTRPPDAAPMQTTTGTSATTNTYSSNRNKNRNSRATTMATTATANSTSNASTNNTTTIFEYQQHYHEKETSPPHTQHIRHTTQAPPKQLRRPNKHKTQNTPEQQNKPVPRKKRDI